MDESFPVSVARASVGSLTPRGTWPLNASAKALSNYRRRGQPGVRSGLRLSLRCT